MTLKIPIAEDVADVAKVAAYGARMTWLGCGVTVADTGRKRCAPSPSKSQT